MMNAKLKKQRLINEIKKMFVQQPNDTNLRQQYFKEKNVYKKIIKARKCVVEMNFHKNLHPRTTIQ